MKMKEQQELYQNSGIHGLHLPHVSEFFGVWAMYEPSFNGLKSHVENINIQCHMQALAPLAKLESQGPGYNGPREGSIAIIDLHGTLLKHQSSFDANTSTVAARRSVRAAASDSSVSGILLHLDSPGGTVAGISDLADDIRAVEKPVTAYIEDLGASAAYWLASQADEIFINSSAVVGSIGVFRVVYDLSGAAEDQKIKVHVLKAGEFKGAGVEGSVVTEEQLAEFQKLVDAYYSDFVEAVASGRNMSLAKAKTLADGRVHKGSLAVELGLADGVRSLDEVLAGLDDRGRRFMKGRVMSKDESAVDQDSAAVANVAAEPKAATITELRESLPGASADFLLAQVEAGATLAEAMKAFIVVQAEEKAELAKAREAAEKQVASDAPRKHGVPAIGQSADSDNAETLDFEALVAECMATRKVDRRNACRLVAKRYPEAHEAFLSKAPPARPSRGGE